MAVPAGEECSVPSAGRKPARCPHRHADQPVNSFQPRGGGRRPRRPDDRRTSSYISNRQRQRRKGEADSKLRIRFTGNPACRPGRKSRNRRLLRRFIGTICEPTPLSKYLFLWREAVFRHSLPFLLMQPRLEFLLPWNLSYSEAVHPPDQCRGNRYAPPAVLCGSISPHALRPPLA